MNTVSGSSLALASRTVASLSSNPAISQPFYPCRVTKAQAAMAPLRMGTTIYRPLVPNGDGNQWAPVPVVARVKTDGASGVNED